MTQDTTQAASENADTIALHTVRFRGQNSTTPDFAGVMTWSKFVAGVVGDGHERRTKKDGPLFGMYRLREGMTRRNANVVDVYGWALDVDKATEDQIARTLAALNAAGLAYLCYSTFSDTPARPKLRIVGPLSKRVAAANWPQTWRALVDRFASWSDEQCKDVSRMYYLPACKPDADPVMFVQPGAALDPATMLADPTGIGAERRLDLNAPEVVKGCDGSAYERCPRGTNPLLHGERLAASMPAAISGQGGHIATLRVARALRWGLDLNASVCRSILLDVFNSRCDPPWSETEINHKIDAAGQEEGAPFARGALLPPPPDSFEHLPLIVQRERRFWLREVGSDDFAVRVKEPDLVRKCKDLYGEQELATWNKSENPRIGKATIEDRSRVADRVVTCYFVPHTTFDLETNTLTEGLRVDPKLTPTFNEHVERWLAALAGDELPALKQWIAGCRPALLRAPAPALGIVGPKEAGKSLIAAGLARIWGDPCAPVSAMVLVAQFNGDLTRCPVVLADEKLPNDMSGEDFREKVAARSHSIEPKGKERQVLNGSIRFIVAANNIDRVLGLSGEKCDDDLQAIADRWRLIEVSAERAADCVRTLDPLKSPDGSNVDLAVIARHFLWIMANVEPYRGRFVGAPPDTKILGRLRRSEAARTAPEVFDVIGQFLAEPWEMSAIAADATPKRGEPQPQQRLNYPLVEQDGRLFARYAVLGAIVGETPKAVAVALRPFQKSERAWISAGGTRVRAHELDADRLRQVCALE